MDNREPKQVPNTLMRRQKRRAEYRKNIRRQTQRARRNMRYSMFLVVLFIVLFSAKVVQLLYGISVTEHRKYTEMAANTHTERYPVYSQRGDILDANGKQLAISTYTYTVGITPNVFGPRRASTWTKSEVEEEFCRILDLDLYKFRTDLIKNEKRAYMQVKRAITGTVNDELTAFLTEAAVGGVRRDANQARYYPQGDLAAHLIGFANVRDDNLAGVTGVEAYYDAQLAGTPGYVYRQVDNYWSQPLPNTTEADVEPLAGLQLQLWLQQELQRYVQTAVEEVSDIAGAVNGATAIVMDPRTGAVLAMAGENNFNLNAPAAVPKGMDAAEWNPNQNKEQQDYMTGQLWSNRATRFPHEVGSVIKPFVMAASFDEGLMNKNTPVNDDFVYVTGWRHAISSYDNRSRGMLSPAEAVWDSRNPPFVRIAQEMGIDTFYKYIKALGLRDTTGIDLPNETVGLFHSRPQEIDMAVTSFGEQVTITPLQITNDYVMLANGGTLLQPRVAKALLDAEGNIVQEFPRTAVRRVLSEQSAAELREMMVNVGRYGTAKHAYLPGIEAGYKTGTSGRPLGDSDVDNAHSLTAIALLPADNPKYVIYAGVYDVDYNLSKSAHMLAKQIGDYLIRRDNLPLNYKAYDYNYIFRDRYPEIVLEEERDAARSKLLNGGFWPVLDAGFEADETVASQYPSGGLNSTSNARVWLSDREGALPAARVRLPDFTGLTVQEAEREARRLNLNVSFDGPNRAGVCTSQLVIEPELAGGSDVGAQVREWTLISLRFDGEGQPGNTVDDSIMPGYDNGSGVIYEG